MKLQNLLNDIQYAVIRGARPLDKIEVSGIAFDSREAEEGFLFVCLCGMRSDGHAYIEEACQRGAVVLVIEKMVHEGSVLIFPDNVTVLLVKDSREALAYLSAAWFGYPAEKLKIIGVTGTKGKTTVSWMIHRLLEKAGYKCGIIGTIETVIDKEHFPARNTTPESFTIQKYFAKMVETGCEYAVMEVSSQGIKQKRIEGIWFEVGIFTNFGEDHIGPGEHESMEEYRYFKSLLFKQCRIGIGNLDDIQCGYMFQRSGCRKYGFTCQEEKFSCALFEVLEEFRVFRAEDIRLVMEETGPATRFVLDGEKYRITMPGVFNVYNALASLLTLYVLGIDISECKDAISTVHVRGRMERIATDESIACYVDYAHNAMSLHQVLCTFRQYEPNRILLVFGCGGNRAKSRRSEMGEVAGKLADYIVITSDNPRYEEPELIIKDILEGIKECSGTYKVIPDRREAVRHAIQEACEGDIVLIAGKGHENYQEICGVRYPMDDRQLVVEALEETKGERKNKDG